MLVVDRNSLPIRKWEMLSSLIDKDWVDPCLKKYKTRMHSSRMRTAHFSDARGVYVPFTETHPFPEITFTENPLCREPLFTETPPSTEAKRPPPMKNMGQGRKWHHTDTPWTEWQTGVKTLPCHKLRFRLMTNWKQEISNFKLCKKMWCVMQTIFCWEVGLGRERIGL